MKSPTPYPLLTLVAGLVVLAAIAPSLIALSESLLPLVVVAGIVGIALRLVFVHTRRW
jgi:hypothetical protein